MLGVGGLGRLGVQYARRMGLEVVAIDRGGDRAELSKKLGAHHYVDSSVTDIAKALQTLGGARWSWPRPQAAATALPPEAVANTTCAPPSAWSALAISVAELSI